MSHSVIVERRQDWYGDELPDVGYRRYKRGSGKELTPLTDEEYATGEWVDVTATSDPMDVHVYMRIR